MVMMNRRSMLITAGAGTAAAAALLPAADAARRIPSSFRRAPLVTTGGSTAAGLVDVPVRVDGPSAQLRFVTAEGYTFISGQTEPNNVARLKNLPLALEFTNDGSTDWGAGTVLTVGTTELTASGLVGTAKNQLVIIGASNTAPPAVTAERATEAGTPLRLNRVVPAGKKLTIPLDIRVANGVHGPSLAVVQMIAYLQVSRVTQGYFEVQSPEAVLTR